MTEEVQQWVIGFWDRLDKDAYILKEANEYTSEVVVTDLPLGTVHKFPQQVSLIIADGNMLDIEPDIRGQLMSVPLMVQFCKEIITHPKVAEHLPNQLLALLAKITTLHRQPTRKV